MRSRLLKQTLVRLELPVRRGWRESRLLVHSDGWRRLLLLLLLLRQLLLRVLNKVCRCRRNVRWLLLLLLQHVLVDARELRLLVHTDRLLRLECVWGMRREWGWGREIGLLIDPNQCPGCRWWWRCYW